MKRRALGFLGRMLRIPLPDVLTPRRARIGDAQGSPDPIPLEQILGGSPIASSVPLLASADDGFTSSLWSCTPGCFRWFYRSDEIVHLLEGEVRVTPDDGSEAFDITSGEVVFFPRGSSAVWNITKTVRKVALFRSDPPDLLSRLRGALRRHRTA